MGGGGVQLIARKPRLGLSPARAYVALFASAPFSAALGAIGVAQRHLSGSPADVIGDDVFIATAFYGFMTWITTMFVGSILIPPIVGISRLLPAPAWAHGLIAVGIGIVTGALTHATILGVGRELTSLYRNALIDGAILGGIAALGAVIAVGMLQKFRSV